MCTCLRLSAENGAIVVGRTMEFGAPLESMIAALPRGYDGSSPAPAGVGKQWQGRDGVVGASVFGSATTPPTE
jgi:choloylglycine hydrolase